MSDVGNDVSFSPQRGCECYKKLETYGIPLYIRDENNYFGAESQEKIDFEKAFRLPGILKINESIKEYLFVEDNELCNVFTHMAEVIPNLSDFEQNLLSFWILDMFIEGLLTAQNAKMNFDNQKATLQWIAYMFNYIQKVNPTRENLFEHLKAVLFHIDCKKKVHEHPEERTGESNHTISDKEESIEDSHEDWKGKEIWKLPLPPSVDENKREQYDEIPTSEGEEEEKSEGKEVQSTANGSSESYYLISEGNEAEDESSTNLFDMKKILEILYRIFGSFWVYLEIQTVFHTMPPITQVDLPYTLRVPKPFLKLDSTTLLRPDKIGRRASYSERLSEEMSSDLKDHKNDFILPLQLADESKIILKHYFPQPSSQRSVLGRRKT